MSTDQERRVASLANYRLAERKTELRHIAAHHTVRRRLLEHGLTRSPTKFKLPANPVLQRRTKEDNPTSNSEIQEEVQLTPNTVINRNSLTVPEAPDVPTQRLTRALVKRYLQDTEPTKIPNFKLYSKYNDEEDYADKDINPYRDDPDIPDLGEILQRLDRLCAAEQRMLTTAPEPSRPSSITRSSVVSGWNGIMVYLDEPSPPGSKKVEMVFIEPQSVTGVDDLERAGQFSPRAKRFDLLQGIGKQDETREKTKWTYRGDEHEGEMGLFGQAADDVGAVSKLARWRNRKGKTFSAELQISLSIHLE